MTIDTDAQRLCLKYKGLIFCSIIVQNILFHKTISDSGGSQSSLVIRIGIDIFFYARRGYQPFRNPLKYHFSFFQFFETFKTRKLFFCLIFKLLFLIFPEMFEAAGEVSTLTHIFRLEFQGPF